ncbi:MAG: pyruvate kinase [Spirochaetaceae bacterium]|jgi:pyruvate kinase|nr:pyruvate kinase [Spirochaetaceae bacterium]
MKRKQTKIVATISDLKCDVEFLTELYENGMDVVRLNTAHQNHEDTLKVINNVRKVSEKIALLLDTKGPEVRTCEMEETLDVKEGETILITSEKVKGVKSFNVNYSGFVNDVAPGHIVLIDDGETGMKVLEKKGSSLVCVILNDGEIKNNKSVNVPDVAIQLPSLSQKDRDYIKFAAENHLDFIAHSFVRNKQDVMDVQEILDQYNSDAKIIAKIENREGVENIEEILDFAHGVMIARGDLGIEIPAEEVPIVQKKIIDLCIRRAQPVITATQMLHTMIKNPRPTRAEVSDVANAVFDGTDALMLSGETAYGDYPVESVKTMANIAIKVEAQKPHAFSRKGYQDDTVRSYLARNAVKAAVKLPIAAIVSDTHSGYSARILASHRSHVPIYVMCHTKDVMRRLSLNYGLYPDFIEAAETITDLTTRNLNFLVKETELNITDLVILMAGNPQSTEAADFIEINTIANCVKNALT